METIDIKELQSLELNILHELHKYCEKHGIRYYLYAGTLLGAVRHMGFIPWDDDIDICMPRPDYEKLYELVKKEPVADYLELRSVRDNEHFNAPFFKLVDIRTDGHEDYLREDINNGVWVDIFPMDGVPADDEQRNALLDDLKKTQKTLEKVVRPYHWCANPLKLAKRAVLYCLYHSKDYRAMANEVDNKAKAYDYDTSDLVCVSVFDGWKRLFKKEWYDKAVLSKFEQYEFYIPEDFDDILMYMYGDYMTPPPVEQQVSHHNYHAWWVDQTK